jgi:hypothetical protein
VLVRLVGQAPITGTVYELEKLRGVVAASSAAGEDLKHEITIGTVEHFPVERALTAFAGARCVSVGGFHGIGAKQTALHNIGSRILSERRVVTRD